MDFLTNDELIAFLVELGYLRSDAIVSAFKKVDRVNFVPESYKNQAYANIPLPIGAGQTISQPLTVAFLLELLNAGQGDKVLDIGAGSGWVSALLGEIVGANGHVYAYEIVEAVGKFGKQNIERFGSKNVSYRIEDVFDSFEENAPYDRIVAGAGFDAIPEELKQVLKSGGILVAPTAKGDIRKVVRKADESFVEEVFPGFVFVPVTGKWRG